VSTVYPEDLKPPPERPLDAIVATTGPTVAVEHTLYQSFPGEIRDNRRLGRIHEFCKGISGSLPEGRFDLWVAPGAVDGTWKHGPHAARRLDSRNGSHAQRRPDPAGHLGGSPS
jgi:hypothetical protein